MEKSKNIETEIENDNPNKSEEDEKLDLEYKKNLSDLVDKIITESVSEVKSGNNIANLIHYIGSHLSMFFLGILIFKTISDGGFSQIIFSYICITLCLYLYVQFYINESNARYIKCKINTYKNLLYLFELDDNHNCISEQQKMYVFSLISVLEIEIKTLIENDNKGIIDKIINFIKR